MKTRQKLACLGLLLALALGPAGKAVAGQTPRPAGPGGPLVVRCPEGTGTLAQRFEWARQEARRRNFPTGYWVGYSMEKLMEEHAFIGFFGRSRSEDLSLGAVLGGEKTLYPSRLRNVSYFSGWNRSGDREDPDQMVKWVKKRIGVLFRYAKVADALPETVGATDDHLPVAFEGKPLLWLGETTDEESLRVLAAMYDRPAAGKLAERIVSTAGIHENPAPVVPFLERVAKSRAAEPVRVEAVSALGGFPDEKIVGILVPLAKSDASQDVREEAIQILGDIARPEAVDALIEIARSSGSVEVREEAVQALAGNPSAKVLSALEKIIANDKEQEIQEEAIQALAEMKDGTGLSLLIKTAKTHAVVEIRKTAIEALSESSDPRALAALVELAKKK